MIFIELRELSSFLSYFHLKETSNNYYDYSSMNNHDKPVDLREKIEYLHEKIDHLQEQINKSGLFELKMKFIDFIDNTIERLYALENKKPYSS